MTPCNPCRGDSGHWTFRECTTCRVGRCCTTECSPQDVLLPEVYSQLVFPYTSVGCGTLLQDTYDECNGRYRCWKVNRVETICALTFAAHWCSRGKVRYLDVLCYVLCPYNLKRACIGNDQAPKTTTYSHHFCHRTCDKTWHHQQIENLPNIPAQERKSLDQMTFEYWWSHNSPGIVQRRSIGIAQRYSLFLHPFPVEGIW